MIAQVRSAGMTCSTFVLSTSPKASAPIRNNLGEDVSVALLYRCPHVARCAFSRYATGHKTSERVLGIEATSLGLGRQVGAQQQAEDDLLS